MALHNQRSFLLLAALLLAGAAPALRADDMALPPLPGAAPVALDSSASAQAPQPDMAKMQAQLKDLLDQEHSIDQNENALNHAIDRVLDATGLHLGGQAVVQSEDMLVLPYDPKQAFSQNTNGLPTQFNLNGGTGAQRIWPTTGYFDLDLTARPTSELSAEVVYRMEKVFGSFWGQGDITGVRWFNVHGDTPIGFDLGMFHYQNTPLTFWVPQDEYAFEPQVLAMKRDEGRADALIQDQSFPLQGAKADTTLLLFDRLDLDLTTLGLRTAVAGNSNSPLGFGVTFPYDQYWIGGTARFSGETSKAFSLGFSYFNMQESVDTALTPQLVTPQYSGIVGSDFKLSMMDGAVVLHGEGAYSEYNPAYGVADVTWTVGGAGNIILDVKTDSTKLSLHGMYVDQQYINYAAQTRDEDTAYDFSGWVPTGNNLFNPYNGTYNLANQSNLFFSTYNNVIFATNQGPKNGLVLSNGAQPSGLYLAPSPLNLSTPEGLATPDRAGFGGDLKGSYFGTGFFQPRIFGSLYTEPEVSYEVSSAVGRRTYGKGGAGLALDFAALGWLPLKVSAGAVVEDTQSNSFVAFTSTRLAYDMDYEAFKNIHILAGFEHADMNGGNVWDYGSGPVYEWQNYTYDIYVAGLDWHLSKASDVFLTYAFDQFQNVDYGNTQLQALGYVDVFSADTQTQEFEAKLRVGF